MSKLSVKFLGQGLFWLSNPKGIPMPFWEKTLIRTFVIMFFYLLSKTIFYSYDCFQTKFSSETYLFLIVSAHVNSSLMKLVSGRIDLRTFWEIPWYLFRTFRGYLLCTHYHHNYHQLWWFLQVNHTGETDFSIWIITFSYCTMICTHYNTRVQFFTQNPVLHSVLEFLLHNKHGF